MDDKEIKRLISIFKKNPFLSELEFEESGKKIKLKRDHLPAQGSAPPAPVVERPAPRIEPTHKTAESSGNLFKIESPMVGTFYRASSPSSKPFVDVGDVVRKGQVVCIIEAMKLMNEIESDMEGRLIEILPQNGKPVEYGEPLFLLEPL